MKNNGPVCRRIQPDAGRIDLKNDLKLFELSMIYRYQLDDLPKEEPSLLVVWKGDRFLEAKGLAESNIRRQLKRLRDAMLVDKQENQYRMSEFAPLSELFETKIERFIVPQTIDRIKEYLAHLDKV